VRASESKADKGDGTMAHSKDKVAMRRAKGKHATQEHLSKKAKKALKEKKKIEREFHEAEAEIDKKDGAVMVCSSVVFEAQPDLFLLANGDAQAAFCFVFPNIKES
jgi:hypothetical protein